MRHVVRLIETFRPRLRAGAGKLLCGWVACGLLLVMGGQSLRAASGNIVTLPSGPNKNRSGLRLEIDPRWVVGMGYRPVRVRISPQPPGPAPADRTVEVHLRPSSWSSGAKAPRATARVELKQGDLFGETVVSIPQIGVWNMMSVETTEDGWRHRELCTDYIGVTSNNYQVSPDNTPSILVVHWAADDRLLGFLATGSVNAYRPAASRAKFLYAEPVPVLKEGLLIPLLLPQVEPTFSNWPPALGGLSPTAIPVVQLPDIRALAGRFPENYANAYSTDPLDIFTTTTPPTTNSIRRLVEDLPNFDLIPPHLLPDRWIDLTNVDVLVISREELVGLQRQFPQKWEAVRTWLSSGPTLIVYGAGESFEYCAAIEKSLLLSPYAPPGQDGADEARWSAPERKHFKQQIDAVQPVQGGQTWVQQQQRILRMANRSPPSRPAGSRPFLYRAAGRGQLVALAASDPFPGYEEEWNAIFNALPSRNWLAYQRHGVSHYQENIQFWNFLIEGIGRAPVKSFLFLITLFAVVIGPINYFALHRRGRLYLLLVTVPGGAALVSAGLFTFAVFADGLGSRVRLRSYTELDPSHQQSITWSRQSYYSGFAPSRGMSFPVEAIVLPIEHRPVFMGGGQDTSRELVWSDTQDLTRGYLTSRQIAQFLVIEPKPTELHVEIEPTAAGELPRIVNKLGVEIERLIARDAAEQLYEVVDLPAGQSREAQAVEAKQAAAEWQQLERAARPEFPPHFDPSSLDDVSQFFQSRSWRYQSQLSPPTFQTSVMELGISQAVATNFESLQPREYYAILSKSPFVSLGLSSIGSESGFHLVKGRW